MSQESPKHGRIGLLLTLDQEYSWWTFKPCQELETLEEAELDAQPRPEEATAALTVVYVDFPADAKASERLS